MLWRWVKNVSFTSVEALPRHLGCEDPRAELERLQTLPDSDAQKALPQAGSRYAVDFLVTQEVTLSGKTDAET